jgi:hypothetical protein
VLAYNLDGALELLGKNSKLKGFGDPLVANFFQVLHLRCEFEDNVQALRGSQSLDAVCYHGQVLNLEEQCDQLAVKAADLVDQEDHVRNFERLYAAHTFVGAHTSSRICPLGESRYLGCNLLGSVYII